MGGAPLLLFRPAASPRAAPAGRAGGYGPPRPIFAAPARPAAYPAANLPPRKGKMRAVRQLLFFPFISKAPNPKLSVSSSFRGAKVRDFPFTKYSALTEYLKETLDARPTNVGHVHF